MANITSKIVEVRNIQATIGTEDNLLVVDNALLGMTFREIFEQAGVPVVEGTDVQFTINGSIPASLDDELTEDYIEDDSFVATLGSKPKGA